MEESSRTAQATETAPRWQPVGALERRILGVLIEKAKTTPDAYPLSLNALASGCNQKSNRYPQMQVEPEDLEPALAHLKQLGAVTEVMGGGRVSRFRHHMYEWLGVGKLELALMAELLLRGAQTLGELRSRASRMEPIADMSALRPALDSLAEKRLIVYLTPAGRGQVVTHALYEPRELEKLRSQFAQHGRGSADEEGERDRAEDLPRAGGAPALAAAAGELQAIRDEVRHLRDEFEQLKLELASLRTGSA